MSITTSMTDLHVEDVEYLRHLSGPLLARIYRRQNVQPHAALVSLHGGRWTRESRLTNAVIDEALARDGVLVMALDIRMPPVARYPDCLADINFAIRWLKSHAKEAGIPAGCVGGIGTSSGGHQMMLSAMRPRDPRYAALSDADGDASLGFVVACWPVLDPLARYRMAQAKEMADHVAAHDAFWPSEDAQAEGNPQMILERGEAVELPPALIIQGTADTILPDDMADRFAAAYRKAGGHVDLRKFEGQTHTFITKDPGTEASKSAIGQIKAFVRAMTA
ncbi:MAG: alpha/beta hydrolase [Xanthobacteraceae bacterium]